MRFSIIIPVHNRKEKLFKCLKSIRSQNYSKEKYEIIVVDDDSDQDLRPIAAGLGTKYVKLKNGPNGPAKARNLGAKEAGGQYLAFTDSDCVVPQSWLKTFEDAYQKHPDIAGVGGYLQAPSKLLKTNIFAQYEAWNERSYFPKSQIPEKPYISTERDEHPFETNNISYKKSIFEELGGFDESFPHYVSGEDGDLKERVVKAGYAVLFVPIKVTHYQDYSFRSFWRRQQTRGAGILKYRYDHGLRRRSRLEIALRMGLAPLVAARSLFDCLRVRQLPASAVKLAALSKIAYLARQIGKVLYFDKMH